MNRRIGHFLTECWMRRSVLGGLVATLGLCLSLGACHRQAPADLTGSLPASVLSPYLSIQEGLAKDSLDGLAANATAIASASASLGAPGGRIDGDARKLAAATTLADARDKFGALSETLVSYSKAGKRPLPSGVREAFCPMVQKPWLQRGSMISNPYFGKEMPGCGEFK